MSIAITTQFICFTVLSLVVIIGALGVVLLESIVYSAFLLGGVFMSVAGLYLLLNASFVAAAQVLVYVGAVNVLIIFAIITAIIVQLWFKELNLSLLIGISMILNMIVAGLFGILVPVSLKKLNIDPALASSVFVTTITDVIGFLSFLGLGSFYFLN